jgi:hypothetical protein
MFSDREGKWVARYTARGYPFTDWEPPMPRIDDQYLDGSIYLYRSRDEAELGENIGGSGFLVEVPAEKIPPPWHFTYAVTNRHVIKKLATCIRMNTKDGKTDVFERTQKNWTCSSTDDLAVCAVPDSLFTVYSNKSVSFEQLLTEQQIFEHEIGPGDEVVAIGRFINHEGKQRNNPTVRFGFISQMPNEPIEYDGQHQESFLCEVKSIGGYSGSPVYLAPDPENTRIGKRKPLGGENRWGTRLLGVDWAHLTNWESAIDDKGYELPHIRFPINTGMMAVVPAWKLRDLLMTPHLKAAREADEERELRRRNAPKVSLDSSNAPAAPSDDANPDHLEDFKRLVDVAARKRPQGDQT